MQAITVGGPSNPEELVLRDMADGPPHVVGPHDVRITIVAAGVNRADLLQRAGHYPPPVGAPPGLGLECSGTIAEVGNQVKGFMVGDTVAALLDGGGYAQSVVVPAGQILPHALASSPPSASYSSEIPLSNGQLFPIEVKTALDHLDPVSAAVIVLAALPEALVTAWSNLVEVGRLQAGETVLIHGGSGGVGSIAIQLARALGATVATTASGSERLDRCAQLGAQILIDHRTEDFPEVIAKATNGRGVDLILDVIGASYLSRNIEALALDGRLVVIGLQGGRQAEVDLVSLVSRRLSVTGTTLRTRSADEKARLVGEVAAHAWPLVFQGLVRPVVGAMLPLEQADEAHQLLASGKVFGKVLLIPDPTYQD